MFMTTFIRSSIVVMALLLSSLITSIALAEVCTQPSVEMTSPFLQLAADSNSRQEKIRKQKRKLRKLKEKRQAKELARDKLNFKKAKLKEKHVTAVTHKYDKEQKQLETTYEKQRKAYIANGKQDALPELRKAFSKSANELAAARERDLITGNNTYINATAGIDDKLKKLNTDISGLSSEIGKKQKDLDKLEKNRG